MACGMTLQLALKSDSPSRLIDPVVIGDKEVPSYSQCIKDGTREATDLFARASKASKSKSARDALKNYHAIFVSTMLGLEPASGELRMAYTSRQKAAETRMTEAWTRFTLEQ